MNSSRTTVKLLFFPFINTARTLNPFLFTLCCWHQKWNSQISKFIEVLTMIYFFLRANSFFTLQFLKAISKFQFHAVSNWLLENVLFYLTTVFLLSSFLLINEFIKFFSRRKQKLYRLITPVHLYYSGSSNPSFICYYSEIYFLHWHEERAASR